MLATYSFKVSMRLKSVKNIQKITKSMKMVSAAKYAKAERELQPARVYGQGAAGKGGGPVPTTRTVVCCLFHAGPYKWRR